LMGSAVQLDVSVLLEEMSQSLGHISCKNLNCITSIMLNYNAYLT